MRAHGMTPPLAIAIGAAALGTVLLFMTLMPVGADPAPADARTADVMPDKLPALDPPPLASYAAIAERPLFNPGRTKDVATPATQPELPPLTDYRLVGLVVGPDTQRALVARGAETLSLKPGDSLDGRRVASIGPRGVTLSANGSEELLAFPRGGRRGTARGVAMVEGFPLPSSDPMNPDQPNSAQANP